MLCTLLGHRPTIKRKIVTTKRHGETRTSVVMARRCTDCGAWLDFDVVLKNQPYAERKKARLIKAYNPLPLDSMKQLGRDDGEALARHMDKQFLEAYNPLSLDKPHPDGIVELLARENERRGISYKPPQVVIGERPSTPGYTTETNPMVYIDGILHKWVDGGDMWKTGTWIPVK
jgi:hypothetical protein